MITENLYKIDKRMTDTSEKDSYEEEPAILVSKVKASMKLPGRKKSPGTDEILIQLFQATETEPVKILTRILKPTGSQNQVPLPATVKAKFMRPVLVRRKMVSSSGILRRWWGLLSSKTHIPTLV